MREAAATYGQYVRSVELSYAEPYFLDTRSSMGVDLFAKETIANNYLSYGTESYGGTLKWGLPLREDLSFQLRYSAYTQKITLPYYLNDCNNINPDFANTFPTPGAINAATAAGGTLWPGYVAALAAGTNTNCYTYGQASLPVRVELAAGSYLTSMVGYGLILQHARQQQESHQRPVCQFRPGLRRCRRRCLLYPLHVRCPQLLRGRHRPGEHFSSAGRRYHGFGSCPQNECTSNSDYVRMLDDFKMGPNLVRGFEPAGIGPRDITRRHDER